MSKNLDIVKSRRQYSIGFTIFAIIFVVPGLILLYSGDTSQGMSLIALGFATMFFATVLIQASSSTKEHRELDYRMTMTMKKIHDLERKLDEILKNLKNKEP